MREERTDKVFEMIAEDLLSRLETVSRDWSKPWFTTTFQGLPQSLEGRHYSSVNTLLLMSVCQRNNYTVPVFVTYEHALSEGCHVRKGEKSTPVIYYKPLAFPKDRSSGRKAVTMRIYNMMNDEEKDDFMVKFLSDVHHVFNIDQTNYSEIYPYRYGMFKEKFLSPGAASDEKGMATCPVLDDMLRDKTWICSITQAFGDNAYYSPHRDNIVVPLKGQFKTGEDFYETLLHEMGHSTGAGGRLNRIDSSSSQNADAYAIEELIAETFAATKSMEYGFDPHIKTEARQYLGIWMDEIRQKPADMMRHIITQVSRINYMYNDVLQLDSSSQSCSLAGRMAPRRIAHEGQKNASGLAMSRDNMLGAMLSLSRMAVSEPSNQNVME